MEVMKTPSMRLLTTFLAMALLATTLRADITPTNPGNPVFRVFIAIPAKQGGEGMTFDGKRPLMTITSAREALLAQDEKGVALQLNASDAETFSLLTRQYPKGFLLFVAEGRVLEAWHVMKPINDGRLGFQYPDHAAAANYLRKRFRLGEFRQ
jgi:hypothetical protein